MMERIIRLLLTALALVAVIALTSCEKEDINGDIDAPNFTENGGDMFTDEDLEYEYDGAECVKISLLGTSATSSSEAVTIDGSSITVTRGGTYLVSGVLDGGRITVYAPKEDVRLVLCGAEINASGTAAIYVKSADKLILTLDKESSSSVTVSGEIDEESDGIDGAIFSRADLTFNGTGSLTVESPTGHGIVAKDDLIISGAEIEVGCSGHAFDVNDSMRLTSTVLKISAGKDGIHVENSDDTSLGYVYIMDGSVSISAEGDGISASSSIQIDGGDLDIITGGGYINAEKDTSDNWGGHMGRPGGSRPTPGGSFDTTTDTSSEDSTSIKGIKATSAIMITGGSIRIDSADDSIHSDNSIVIKGGILEISSGDDGVHAEESLAITGGGITISTSYEGLEAMHVAVSGGEITLVASDDGINAAGGTDGSGMGGMRPGGDFGGMMGGSSAGSIVISGGTLSITASGDGLDANGTLEISGGYTTVAGPTVGDTATLDYDVSGVITGGTFIGTGASGMAQTFSDSEQGVIAVSVGGSMPAGKEIILTDGGGNEIVRYSPPLSFTVVIISTPDMRKGESYTITIGDASGTFTAT